MEKRADIFSILKSEGKLENILVYSAQEVENDPIEHTKELNFLNPLPIKALVRPVSFEALYWKYWGQIPSGSIQAIIEKKNVTLIKNADKIEYKGNVYKVYKDDSKGFSIIEKTDYAIIVLGLKI